MATTSPSKVLPADRLAEIEGDLHAGRIPGNWRALLDSHRALEEIVQAVVEWDWMEEHRPRWTDDPERASQYGNWCSDACGRVFRWAKEAGFKSRHAAGAEAK